jgi:hypothetical protein
MTKKLSRRAVWKHNSYFGFTALTRRNMLTIADAPSTTPRAQDLANQIAALTTELAEELKTRIDP